MASEFRFTLSRPYQFEELGGSLSLATQRSTIEFSKSVRDASRVKFIKESYGGDYGDALGGATPPDMAMRMASSGFERASGGLVDGSGRWRSNYGGYKHMYEFIVASSPTSQPNRYDSGKKQWVVEVGGKKGGNIEGQTTDEILYHTNYGTNPRRVDGWGFDLRGGRAEVLGRDGWGTMGMPPKGFIEAGIEHAYKNSRGELMHRTNYLVGDAIQDFVDRRTEAFWNRRNTNLEG